MTVPQKHEGLEGWPLGPDGWRYLCTKEKPMPKNAPGHWLHPDSVDDGGCSEGCCDDYKCIHCGKCYRIEAPD